MEHSVVYSRIHQLIDYAVDRCLITDEDRVWARNRLLADLQMDHYEEPEELPGEASLPEILDDLCGAALETGALKEDSIVYRDIFDTRLMGELTPPPHEVREHFRQIYRESPVKATDWFYEFSQDTNYIRRDRILRDARWIVTTEYGDIDITINLSKPEKDPKAIAAARNMPKSEYPRCQLCMENEGYEGRVNHPARGNHRLIPIEIGGSPWFFQYSPYVYYNEHCIAFNSLHIPMKIDIGAFRRQMDFIKLFPHYFIGSNADLPIVGGSILAHDHFQGGHYTFAMAKAGIEYPLHFSGYLDVEAGIVKWPMSVIRLRADDDGRIVSLAGKILDKWRAYTDESVFIFAETDGEPHNTITPIARRSGEKFEIDLVLRNNITTKEHPLGVFHPHAELHHIKKENIGLIEVMGLAVLPSRLKEELSAVERGILEGRDLTLDDHTAKHAEWVESLKKQYKFTAENTKEILKKEVGIVFARVLEDAGVFKRNAEGRKAFIRFAERVGLEK